MQDQTRSRYSTPNMQKDTNSKYQKILDAASCIPGSVIAMIAVTLDTIKSISTQSTSWLARSPFCPTSSNSCALPFILTCHNPDHARRPAQRTAPDKTIDIEMLSFSLPRLTVIKGPVGGDSGALPPVR